MHLDFLSLIGTEENHMERTLNHFGFEKYSEETFKNQAFSRVVYKYKSSIVRFITVTYINKDVGKFAKFIEIS